MTTTQASIKNAPRDLAELTKSGRFNLRLLAQELGVFGSPDEPNEAGKTAFMSQNNNDQAQTILSLLLEHDKASSGGGAASPRQPSNKSAKKAPNGATTSNVAPTSTPSAAAPTGEGAAQLLQKLSELSTNVGGLREEVQNLTEAIAQLQGIAASSNRFSTIAIGLSLKLAEQVLGAGPSVVLQAVNEDMNEVEAALHALLPADEGEGEPEGNE